MRSAVLTTPRAGGHLLADLLTLAGIDASWWPDRRTVTIVHAAQFHEFTGPPAACVHLRRGDVVAQAVSWAIAAATGGWVETRAEPPYDRRSVSAAVERIERDNATLAAASTATILYEDLVADPAGVIEATWGARPTGAPRTNKLGGGANDRWAARWRAEAA